MAQTSGRGFQVSNLNLPLSNDYDTKRFLYTVEFKVNDPADLCWDSAEQFLEMFGLRDEATLQKWRLFVNQYNTKKSDDIVRTTADYFREQTYFRNNY